MLAELLLVLGGHTSALFTPTGVSPSLASYLHPGEVAALNTLVTLAGKYRAVRSWAEGTQAAARAGVLEASKLRKAPGQYTAVLAGAVRAVLREYDELVVHTEAAVLASDPGYVQRGDGASTFVPLSLLVATFDAWQAPMAALAALVARVPQYTPGELMQHLSDCGSTGHPELRRVFSALLDAVWAHFKAGLVVFLLDGIAADTSTPSAPAIGLDAGADPPHRLYRLDLALVPASVGAPTRESILYVGRVAATLKREGRALPRSLVDKARKDVLSASFDTLDAAVQRTRAEVGEWLWTHILTGRQVAEALESFGNYFLTRDADFSLNVIREVARLRRDRLLLANPLSSSSVIRAYDLDLALLRASVGTDAEADRALEALSWSMPAGHLRPNSKPVPDDGSVRSLFAPALLGTPLALTATVAWPLDLFMTPPAVAAYSDIHAYLYAIRDAHARVLDCWSALSGAQRRRRVWTGADEGGLGEERAARTALARTAWATVRAMLFFLDQLLGHFMTDIVGTQHRRLLEQLPRSTSPARGAQYLDFLTLRQMHARHLAFLREGLLIAERDSAVLVRDILDTCKRFAGLVERWGGDVLPELLQEGDDHGGLLAERTRAVDEISDTLHDLIGDFFRMLLESQAPVAANSAATDDAASSTTRASLSRATLSTGMGPSGASEVDDALMARHIEQLLLRLDFNGVLTLWQEGRAGRDVLPPRPL
ncbi:hypothetical protein VHUM_00714 [Vanrija humicola]|uniref:Spindle pole body component n=1 Tax=Vanrija humicola TaxID=5417 RepID=A0A7D8V396_VANHU|nr:hypothetical protein VHUM_00714 [Vanrija humicola]